MSQKGLSRWVRWSLVVTFATLASTAYFFYFAYGFGAGELIGHPGREVDIAVGQYKAMYWHSAFWTFQLGVVISLFLTLRFGADAAPVIRYVMRGFSAVLLSFVATTLVGAALLLVFRLFWFQAWSR